MSPRGGALPVLTGPGLRVALDPEALRRCNERFLEQGSFPTGAPTERYGGGFRKS